jgi:hypothetical protein
MRGVLRVCLAVAAFAVLLPAAAFAQEGQIAGTVKDASGAVMPGVLVEVTSPALIEKVRSATTNADGRYNITNLPIGTYQVTFSLEGFAKQQRNDVILSSGFTANINGEMKVGQVTETVVVTASTPAVDVQNARQAITFEGEQLRDLPTNRNVNSLLALTPGITSGYAPGNGTGICSGGIGVFCNPGVTGFNAGGVVAGSSRAFDDNADNTNLSQGRVMVDGQVVNSGGSVPIVGQTGGYTADLANAQEVTIQLSGALGESETGGASINIIPRTGGNRYAGDFNATYTRGDPINAPDNNWKDWFGTNNKAYPGIPAVFQPVISDHDVSGAYGGPIKRDRLWFYSVARTQGIHKLPVGVDFWPNRNEAIWGFNYQPKRTEPRVEYKNIWRNVNARVTYQMSQRNKFNIFWDEQDFCQDPCLGVVSVFTSPESWWSSQAHPNRLQQVSWTNPFTNRILLEAGLSRTSQVYRTNEHREYTNPADIPRIVEVGNTAGQDFDVPGGTGRVNQFAGTPGFFALTSGSLNSSMTPGGGAERRDLNNVRTRASASYVTGSHHAKVGYEGGYYSQLQLNEANNLQMTYNYIWPASTCAATNACGNTSLQFPLNPTNTPLGPDGVTGTADDGRRPIPNNVVFNTGEGTLDDKVMYSAFYAQDQWTLKRLTISGAVRYDHATSWYGQTCVGNYDGNHPTAFIPVQTGGDYAGMAGYCTPDRTDGVSYNDITPRWGVAWDIFGTGRTSVKWNMGKYLNAANIGGLYSGANPARRTVNTLQRNWSDTNGNRIVDCNLTQLTNNGECTGFGDAFGGNADTTRFGRDPLGLDASGIPIGLATTQCGRQEQGIPAAIQAYCAVYGDSLINGSGIRRYEWQFGLGVQHEILPKLSAEVTYNRRKYGNLTVNDQLQVGCDRFNGALDFATCNENMLNYRNPNYDFYSVVAPTDPRLPGGGGYRIIGISTGAVTIPTTTPTAVTIMKELDYYWNGVDTNFVWRGPKGIRVNGGTSTGRQNRDTCHTMVDGPNVKGREGAEYRDGCLQISPWLTRVNGTAAYVIPWVDVLVSTVFQSFPGPELAGTLTYNKQDVIWDPASASRATAVCATATDGVGCLGSTRNSTTTNVQLLNQNELYGERVTTFDVKLAKNIRFANKRATIGVDIYNVFNSDAIESYNVTFTPDNPLTPEVEPNNWLQPTGLISPRFLRLQVQFNF